MAGDTVVVTNDRGSAWGDSVRVVEEMRIGGGRADTISGFGRITGLAVAPDGSVAVFDESVPALRLFDASGSYLGILGREGAGPGEHRSDAGGVRFASRDTIVLNDPGNGRVDRWTRHGDPLSSLTTGAALTGGDLQRDDRGNLYYLAWSGIRHGEYLDLIFVRLGTDGVSRDTIRAPRPALADQVMNAARSSFDPRYGWTVTPMGDRVDWVNDQYAFSLYHGNGVTRIERVADPVGYNPAERASLEARMRRLEQHQPGSRHVELPAHKTPFSMVTAFPDSTIWVAVTVPAEQLQPAGTDEDAVWRSPPVYDVFAYDGTFLGRVRFPDGGRVAWSDGDRVWVIASDEDGIQSVVQYRIPHGATHER